MACTSHDRSPHTPHKDQGYSVMQRTGMVKRRTFAMTKGKAVRVTGRRTPQCCETSRFTQRLHYLFTDGGEVGRSRISAPFTPQEDTGYSFYWSLRLHRGHRATGRIESIEIPVTSCRIQSISSNVQNISVH
jgi:hypothetical protein